MFMLKPNTSSKSRSTAAKLSAQLLAAALGLTLGASPAWAQSNEEYVPIGHDDNADGVDDRWTVSKDGGKTQVGGAYTTEGAAKRAARKATRILRRVQRKLDKTEK